MIITPRELFRYLNKLGMPAEGKHMATSNFTWQELLKKQKEMPTLEILENLLKVATILQW